MTTQIYNGKILIPGGRWIDGGSVVIADGRIDNIYAHSRIFDNIDKTIDAEGDTCCPEALTCTYMAEVAATLWKPLPRLSVLS